MDEQLQVVDFDAAGEDEISPGEILGSQYENDFGLTISSGDNQNHPIMTFDTNNAHRGDLDLAYSSDFNVPPIDNVAIISQDGNSEVPNDNATGGTIKFDFEDPVHLHGVSLFDIDLGESETSITTFDEFGNALNTYDVVGAGDNALQQITFGNEIVSSVEVFLQGSGAVVDLSFYQISDV